MTASFILNGVTTDLITLETGLLGLTGLPGVDAETVRIAEELYTFITTTEANPFHVPRDLQREILRRAKTDPRALSVFMRALSLQAGWEPQPSANRFAKNVDLSFLKKRGGPEQLSAGAVANVRSGMPAPKISQQNRMQAAHGAGSASAEVASAPNPKNVEIYRTAMEYVNSGYHIQRELGLEMLGNHLRELIREGLFLRRDWDLILLRGGFYVPFSVIRLFTCKLGLLVEEGLLQKDEAIYISVSVNSLRRAVLRANVEDVLPGATKTGISLSDGFSLRDGIIVFRDYPSAFISSERINRLKSIAVAISREMDGNERGDFHENIHNYPSSANLGMIDRYLARARTEKNETAVRLLEEAKVLCEEIYNGRLNLFAARNEFSPDVRDRIAWPEGELDIAQLGRLAVSVRNVFDRGGFQNKDRYKLMKFADSMDQVAFGLCALNDGEAGTAVQVRKMAVLVQVLYGIGFGDRGYLEAAERLFRLAEEWDHLNPDVRETKLRTFGALIHHMLVDYQNAYREIFGPLVRNYATALGIPQEERAGYASAKYRATGVFQLAVHLESLGVRDGLAETSARVLRIMSGEPWNRGPLQTFAYGSQGFPSDLRDIGGKGAGLDWLARRVPEMVPKGFMISSRESGHKLSVTEKKTIRKAIKEMERKTGKKLGEDLSVSVRSGGAVSMAGAMDTMLNVTNEESLFAAIEQVYASWDSPASREIRENAGIPAEWGTAVNVVEMVDGTGKDSGSGVAVNNTIPVYAKGKRGDEVVKGRNKATDKLPYALRRILAKKIREFERDWGRPVEVEFTVEEGRLYFLQIRDAHMTREGLIRWYARRVRGGATDKETAIRVLGGREVLESAKEWSVVGGGKMMPVSEITNGRFGGGAPSVREIAFDAKDIAEIQSRGGLAVYVTSNPDAGISIPETLKAGALIAEGGNVLAHLFDVVRSSGIAFVGGMDSITVFKKGDVVTLDPANHRVFRGRYKIRTGPSTAREDIEFLLRR